ncbi:hypothetical protein [Hydrocoleum sp. CS-953]|nr:hypothetical protein [Hydrocoleum sp. CS-953]
MTGSDGFLLDRDLNGARGILIKSVVENFSTTLGDTHSVIRLLSIVKIC